MINIYICEDDNAQRQRLVTLIERVIFIEDLDMAIKSDTADPHQIIADVSQMRESGIYFLDIDLQSDINGIELAAKIRETDTRGFIVFITSHSHLSYLTFKYKVEALDYILKDDQQAIGRRIGECLRDIDAKYKRLSQNTIKSFYVKSRDKSFHLPYDEIINFETSDTPHKVRVYTDKKCIEFYGNISKIIDELDDNFIRCHRSFIINKKYIKHLNIAERRVELTNGTLCDVSVRGMKLFKK